MIVHLKILLDIISSGYNVSPNRDPFYFELNISHFVHISPPADYRGKSRVERSGRRMEDWSKLLASLTKNHFPKRLSSASPHTLSKLYVVSVGFVTPPPSPFNVFPYLRSPRDCCCSILDD